MADAPGPDLLKLPAKKIDRQRPFLKLDPKPATEQPDAGNGVARGCFPPSFFGDLDKGAVEVLTQNVEVLGVLHKAIAKAREVVNAARQVIRALLMAQALAAMLGLGVLPGLALSIPVILLVEAIMSTLEDVLDVIEKKIIGRIAKRLLPRACRVMPHWAPVARGGSNTVVDEEQIVEVQGLVTRSYQNPIDVPFFQWHHWYNWTIHVKADPEFAKVQTRAPNPPTNAKREGGQEPVQEDGTIECQWDLGTLFQNPAAFEAELPPGLEATRSGPMTLADWAWPMPGQFVWASGRHVYDCSRSTLDDGFGQMFTVVNPMKAIASARLEGFKFPENERAVPATQFLFFTCKRGGYIDHDTINDKDYEFIVDLPEPDEEDLEPLAVGRTEKFEPDFDHNTIVLRPRLLVHVNTGAFASTGSPDTPPIIDPIPPEEGTTPRQVRVRVPAKSLGDDVKAYGFVLSLGWHDESGTQAEKVRECTVTLKEIEGLIDRKKRDKPDEITKLVEEAEDEIVEEAKKKVRERITTILGDILGGVVAAIAGILINFFVREVFGRFVKALASAVEDLLTSDEEWLVHFGVNGRWSPLRFDFNGGHQAVNRKVTFFHLPTEPIRLSMCGVDFDPIGDVMRKARKDRIIDLDGREVTWDFICDPDPNDGNKRLELRRKLILRYVFKLLGTLADDNDPTGFVEKKHFGLGDQLHDGFFENVFFTRALDDQRTIVEDRLAPLAEHALHYSIEIKKLPEPK
jgi:hypothetical protein